MKFKIIKFKVLTIFFLITYTNCKAQFGSGFRFGGGAGLSMYVGTQMDATISLNTYKRSEINPGYNVQAYYAPNDKREFGYRILNTKLWALRAEKTLALSSTLNEISFIYQKSFNNNINLKKRSKFTYNLVLGLGVLVYRSTFFTINPNNGILVPFSSVGRGAIPVTSGVQFTKIRPTLCGTWGLNIGTRLSKNFTLYLENTYTLSGSNYLSGNANTDYWQPNNGFLYSALSLYFNFSGKINPLSCPKF